MPHFSAPQFAPRAVPHFSAPHFAPRISAPQIAPRVAVPHLAPRTATPHFAPRAPATRIAAPQVSAPRIQSQISRVAPHVTRTTPHIANMHPAITGQISRALGAHAQQTPHGAAAGALAHSLAPGSQAVRLPGRHGLVTGLRNPFFANRPALARATFAGRFARFAPNWRHFRRFHPVVIGWIGPLFWPYAYDDLLDYTFYPYAYDTFWPYAYNDLYDGMFGLFDGGAGAAYAASPGYAAIGRGTPPGGNGRVGAADFCTGQTPGLTDWQINEIARVVEADDAQRAALDDLSAAVDQARDMMKAACPTDLPSTPTGRIEAMRARLATMLEAVRTVRAPLAKLYGLLSDEQKARFNAMGAGEENEAQARRDLTQVCSERAAGISGLPIERMERAVRPEGAQRAAFDELQNAIAGAGEVLRSSCPTYRPLSAVVRVESMEQRLDAMLRAVDTVAPALAKFYGSLTDEQKERFNRLAPAQG
jgi:LTXXQ motif family protein